MNSKLRDTIWQLIKNTRREAAERQGDDIERLTFETDKAEKAIRQAVGEEMLELTSGLERWIEYNKHDMGELGEFIRTRYAMSGLNELRQKIKQWAAPKETTE